MRCFHKIFQSTTLKKLGIIFLLPLLAISQIIFYFLFRIFFSNTRMEKIKVPTSITKTSETIENQIDAVNALPDRKRGTMSARLSTLDGLLLG